MDTTSIFVALVAAVFGGGGWQAFSNYRKAPREAEGISVDTLTKVIREQRDFYVGVVAEVRAELARKDEQLAEQNRVIGGLRHRIETLENGNGFQA